MTTRVETSRDLDVPVRTAYDQWTQFEDMKLYMDGVESVRQLTDDVLRVTFKRRGVERAWEARITEQIPDARIAWESVSDAPQHAGVVTFHRIDDQSSRMLLQMDFEPNGLLEQYADKVGLVERYTEDAVDAFKSFIEERSRATGAWRGTIGRDDLTGAADTSDDHTRTDAPVEPLGTILPASDDAPAHDERANDGEVRTMADGEIVTDERKAS